MSFCFIFPGQGSQAVGMLGELAQAHPQVKSTFEQASDLLSVDMWAMTQQGPIEQLSQTEHTQPALLTAGVAVWRVWKELGGSDPTMMAGHSLGEYTALTCAGALRFDEAVLLVRDRGRYMQEAVPAGEGAMAAILGLEDEQVKQVCAKATEGNDLCLQAVNFNAPGQVVIAGSAQAIEVGIELAKEAGAKRAMPLPVSIPAHSSLMSAASEKLAERIQSIHVAMPNIAVLHNCNVSVAGSVEEISKHLVTQLDSPVRWVESVQAMHEQGINHFIESGPGRVLGGLVKRIVKGVDVACLEKAAAFEPELAKLNG